MLKKIVFGLLVALLASCGSVKKHNASLGTLYTPVQLRQDVDYTYKKIQKLHPNLYQYISKEDLDRKFDSLKSSITTRLDAKAFYFKLAPVVSEIRQGHISGSFPKRKFTKKERKAISKTKIDLSDIDTRFIEDGLYISRTGPKDSVLLKSQVIAVGTETVPDLFAKYRNTFSSDGFNTTLQNRHIGKNFTSYYAKHVSHRDSIKLILKQGDSVFVKQFKRYLKDSTGLKKSKVDSTKQLEKSKPAIKKTPDEKKQEKAKQKLLKKYKRNYGYVKSRDHYIRSFRFVDSAAQIGYMKVRRWRFGPVKDFLNEVFTKLDSAKTKHLILDLRGNPGGSLDQVADFYAYLAKEDYVFAKPAEVETRLPFTKNFYNRYSNPLSVVVQTLVFPFFAADNLYRISKKDGQLYYRFKQSKIKSPNELGFKGEIYVLIDGGSFSASSIIASKLHGTKSAMFIGEETGGAYNGTVAGQMKLITLPNSKVTYNFGVMNIGTPHQQEPDGFGIKPDVYVVPTVEDFINDIDTELERTLEIIRAKG